MYSPSDPRQKIPRGMSPWSSEYTSSQRAYGPAMSATRYVLIRGVVTNVCTPPSTLAVAPLEMTCQCSGAVTVTSKVALRSGWSKHANIRLASAVSNCEYRYTSSSTGSTNRCRPSPVLEYRQSASTTTTLCSVNPTRGSPVDSSYPDTSTSTPLRVALRIASAAMSMTVSEPASASNATVVVDRKVFSPGAPRPSVRSKTML